MLVNVIVMKSGQACLYSNGKYIKTISQVKMHELIKQGVEVVKESGVRKNG